MLGSAAVELLRDLPRLGNSTNLTPKLAFTRKIARFTHEEVHSLRGIGNWHIRDASNFPDYVPVRVFSPLPPPPPPRCSVSKGMRGQWSND